MDVHALRLSQRYGIFSDFADHQPLVARAATVLVWPLGLSLLYGAGYFLTGQLPVGLDSHAYWLAAQGPLDYSRMPGEVDAYLYSPAFLAAVKPLALLPWPAFCLLWMFLQAMALFWLLWPLPLKWSVPLSLLAVHEMLLGNIYLFLAVVLVQAARAPALWSFAVLTKVASGVGLLWPLARRDGRALLLGVGATVLVVAAGYATDPGAWNAWVAFLLASRSGTTDGPVSYAVRGVVAATLVVLGARTNSSWLLAPALLLASPVFGGVSPLAVLLAIPRLSLGDGAAPPLAHDDALGGRREDGSLVPA